MSTVYIRVCAKSVGFTISNRMHKKTTAIGGAAIAAERRILDVHMSLCPHMSVHK